MNSWQIQHTIRRRALSIDPDTLPTEWHPVVRRVLAARGIRKASDLADSLNELHSPNSLSGIGSATELLAEAVTQQHRIVIVGDFDADGATGTALGLRALRAMGAVDTHYVVPNRMTHGYGLSAQLVEAELHSLRPDLVMTVDNGIASIQGVVAAKQMGSQVVVTDHHLPGAELPDADAIVNPNLPADKFPSKCLAGVGVMFYVMAALRAHLAEQGWFERQGLKPPSMAQWLDLVALGTVADLVPLDRQNRILVAQGLRRMRAGKACAGIGALAAVAGRELSHVTAQDCGFALGPRLNAAGRLDDMGLGIECLLTDDAAQALELARRLDTINRERRGLQDVMEAQAQAALDQVSATLDSPDLPWGVTLYDPAWHPGIVGLVASRVKQQLHRPVIAFAPAGSGDSHLKGSARSQSGLHIRDALANMEAQHPGLIDRFGGHAMAAGLTLPAAHLEKFREVFDAQARSSLCRDDLDGVILSDGELDAAEQTLAFAHELRRVTPWGQAFPQPCFDGVFELREIRVVGERHLKLKVQHPQSGAPLDAIAFNTRRESVPERTSQLRLAYELDVNRYQGQESVQLRVEHIELL